MESFWIINVYDGSHIVMIYGIKLSDLEFSGEMKCKIAVYWLAHLERFIRTVRVKSGT